MDTVIWVHGKHSVKDGEHSITVDEIASVEDIRKQHAKFLNIELPMTSVNKENLALIQNILQKFKGDKSVRIVVDNPDSGKTSVSLGKNFCVHIKDEFLKELLSLHFPKEVYFPKIVKNGEQKWH